MISAHGDRFKSTDSPVFVLTNSEREMIMPFQAACHVLHQTVTSMLPTETETEGAAGDSLSGCATG